MTAIIPKGTAITCPRKGHIIAVTKRDLRSRDPVKLTDLEFEPGQERVAGEAMQCKKELPNKFLCSSFYMKQKSIHTAKGWIPRDPIFEPTSR